MKRQNRNPNATCPVCKTRFYAWRQKDDGTNVCSLECRKKLPSLKKMTKAVALAKEHTLSPTQTAHIRGQIAGLVREQVTHANEVVLGIREWNPTQARVFSTLLNKVVPDLSASHVQLEHSVKDVIDMSRDELERIAAGIDAIDAEVIEDENNQ